MAPPSRPLSLSPDPYRFEFGAGVSHVALGNDLPAYTGPHFEFKLGKNFPYNSQNQFSLVGVYRKAFLSNPSQETRLGLQHFGFEAGYEGWIQPDLISLFLFGGIGADVYASDNVLGSADLPPLSLNDAVALGLALGGGISFGKGLLHLSGAYRPSFGLTGITVEESPIGVPLNPAGFSAGLTLDLMKFGGIGSLPEPNGEKFANGLKVGLIADGSYTYNLNQPGDGLNATRIFDTAPNRPMANLFQFSLVRESDEETPMGLGLVLDTGENPMVSAAGHSLSGDYYDVQQLWGEVRLPAGDKGVKIRAGKIATNLGYEVIEPVNNQISRSWAFGVGLPFTHWGLLSKIPVADNTEMHLGIVKGWDDWAGHEAGVSSLFGVIHDPIDWFHWSVLGSLGAESGRMLSVFDGIATFTAGKFVLTLNGDWGHQGDGGPESPDAHWFAGSINPRINFHHHFALSGRVEAFADPEGVRTDLSQTLAHGALTVHVKPVPENDYDKFPLELRAEIRHDTSSAAAFLSGDQAAQSQTTFATSATLRYDNLLGF